MERKLAFVVTDDSAKLSEDQRGLIRSHCMRLKNKQPNSRRSRQEAKRLHTDSRKAKKDDDADTGAVQPQTKHGHPHFDEEPWASSKPLIVPTRIPLPLAHELAVYPFPVVLDRSSQALFHRCACSRRGLEPVRPQITWATETDNYSRSILDMPCNPVRDVVFPFKLFDIQVDVQADRTWLAGLLASDELFFRATIVMASVSDDLVAGRKTSSQTQRRLQYLLPLLNKRLAFRSSPWDTVALFVIGILASVATLCGDYASAAMHSKGIDEILRLRGRNLRAQDMMLSLALERLSFASSLLTDQWSPINMVAERIAPNFSEQVLLTYGARAMLQPDFIPDGRLVPVFHALQCTTIVLDTHEFGAPSINGVLLSQAMGFVQSELLELRTQVRDGLSSLILLSLLAFHATTFRLPGLYEHPCCSVLAGSLLEAFSANERGIQMLPETMRIWLILIGALTAKGDEARIAAWRRYCTQAVSEGPWETIRQEARKVMWIDSIHNEVGKAALSMLQA